MFASPEVPLRVEAETALELSWQLHRVRGVGTGQFPQLSRTATEFPEFGSLSKPRMMTIGGVNSDSSYSVSMATIGVV